MGKNHNLLKIELKLEFLILLHLKRGWE